MPKDALAQVLLDFGRTPGRYALRLREPQELYAQFDTVALWAQGRIPELLQHDAPALKAAAVLFIHRACFAQENNHYQVLGLVPGPVDADMLRARYRSLIRLTHPDMGVEGLPSAAAGMVNRAQEVLANPQLREKYDRELEVGIRPIWQGANAPPAPAPRKVQGAPRVRLDARHHASSGDRWRALWARYPTQARLLLTVAGVGVLVVVLLVWAANDAPGGALVVARAPPPQALQSSSNSARKPAPSPSLGQTVLSPERVPAPLVAETGTASGDDHAQLALSRDAMRLPPLATALPPPPEPKPITAVLPPPRPARAAPQPEFIAAASAQPPPAAVRRTSDAGVSRPTREPEPPAAALQANAGSARAQAPAPVPTPPVDSPRATSEIRAERGGTPSVARAADPPRPAPAAAAPAIAALESGAPTSAAPQAPQWSVDAPGATQYLRDLLALLERPQEAGRTHELLRSMNVKGNLLSPGLRLARDYPQLRVTSLALTETQRPGELDVRGTVHLAAQNPQTAAGTFARYRVAAHFVGTEGGTALTRLELLDAQ